jgi:hypothetical protein
LDISEHNRYFFSTSIYRIVMVDDDPEIGARIVSHASIIICTGSLDDQLG